MLIRSGVASRAMRTVNRKDTTTSAIEYSLTAARDKLGARSLAEAAALIAADLVSQALNAT